MFPGGRHKRTSSTATTDTSNYGHEHANGGDTSSPFVSPVASSFQVNFDFELPPPTSHLASPLRPSTDSFVLPNNQSYSRPRASDAIVGASDVPSESPISLRPPTLPPIPRVASVYENKRGGSSEAPRNREPIAEGITENDDRNVANAGQIRSLRQSLSFEDADIHESSTFGANVTSESGTPRMESSLFPKMSPPAASSPTNVPLMTREFIDSRDRPYHRPPQRPTVQTNLSTSNLLATRSPAHLGANAPLSSNSAASRLSPNSSIQSSSQPSTSAGLSGTTARPSTRASLASASTSSLPVVTIGTPYSETSPSFPLPERVATRPQTSKTTATVAGVSIPTHYSTSGKLDKPDKSEKPEAKPTEHKKKGRLLNPIHLLQRRRSGQDGDATVENRAERQAQAQALARQRDIAAVGVDKLPADFDPRIKGKVVHDFSAPRAKRNTFGEVDPLAPSQHTSSNSGDALLSADGATQGRPSFNNQATSDGSARVSTHTHTPVFMEHLDENTETSWRGSSLQAETLENKGFLQRASKHSASSQSQDSTTLPPFARRSQTLDPMQASFFHDDDSKRSSNPVSEKGRDSFRSSNSEISPITARSSSHQGYTKGSISPVSPRSPDKTFRPTSFGQTSWTSSEENQLRDSGDLPPRHYSAALSPPAMDTIAESPVRVSAEGIPPFRYQSQEFHASSLRPRTEGARPQHPPAVPKEDTLQPPQVPTPSGDSESPDSRSLFERTASMPTPDQTPEPELVENAVHFKAPRSPPRLVEKRTSATGHSKRSPPSGPKHNASTASRFSFQYAGGENAAEEHALEEKHRKIVKKSDIKPSSSREPNPYDDDDDYFDEDAMDDMDEMEFQAQQEEAALGSFSPSQTLWSVQQARQELRASDSDDESESGENVSADGLHLHAAHPDHLAFSNLPADGSQPTTSDNHWRSSSDGSHTQSSTTSPRRSRINNASTLTINTNVGNFSATGNPMMSSGFTVPAPRPSHVSDMEQPPEVISQTMSVYDPKVPSAGYGNLPLNPQTLPQSTNSHAAPLQALRYGGNESIHHDAVTRGVELEAPFNSPRTAESSTEAGNHNAQRKWSTSDASMKSTQDMVTSPSSARSKSGDLGRRSAIRTSRTSQNDENTTDRITSQSSNAGRYRNGSSVSSPQSAGKNSVEEQNAFVGFNFDLDENEESSSRPDSHKQIPQLQYGTGQMKDANLAQADWRGLDQWTTAPNQGPASLQRALGPPHSQAGIHNSSFPYTGDFGRSGHARNDHSVGQIAPHITNSNNDLGEDMYFDDGNFDNDISTLHGTAIDENNFDDDSFLARGNAVVDPQDHSPVAVANFCSDGPYPSFALPNAMKAHQRNSQMMLQDLPLQEYVDPKLIPQRNPSEDAKRLGLKSRAPPWPVDPTNPEVLLDTQSNLQLYHAALADAAHKAAAEGRFVRAPSVSTVGSVHLSSGLINDDRAVLSSGEQPPGAAISNANGNDVSRGLSKQILNSQWMGQTLSGPSEMSFDFGFEHDLGDELVDDSFGNDDDLVAAANAEVLANDDEGFYGQEFHFYGRPRSNSGEIHPINGGFFGEDGDDGLTRNKSLKEPNLTPITERSEFSTRNSFIGPGFGQFGSASAGPFGPHSPALGRMPVSPFMENEFTEITSFDQLRKFRANTFGGSNGSLNSSNRSSAHSLQAGYSPSGNARPTMFGPPGGSPMAYGYSNDSNSSSNPSSAQPGVPGQFMAIQDSPHSNTSGNYVPLPVDTDATPKRPATNMSVAEPTTARKVVPPPVYGSQHSRKGSGADSVTYVREPQSAGSGKPRWVLERRRTGEQGQQELVGRELVQGGWI